MENLTGHVLVASPFLVDPNFVQTVVLLVHHSEEGAFGLVLNRRHEKTVQELWSEFGEGPCERNHPLHIGGPVSGPLVAIHDDQIHSELEIIPGVHFAAHRDHLAALVSDDRGRCLLFLGHSGWAGGQLENELATGSWLVGPAKSEYIFDQPADLWRRVTHEIGREILADTVRPRHRPPEPSRN